MSVETRSPTNDWRDFRYAAEQAEPRWNDLPQEERDRLWKFANDFVANFPRLKARCIQCRQQFGWHQIYRCADCHAPLCGTCIRPHFLNERSPAEDSNGN